MPTNHADSASSAKPNISSLISSLATPTQSAPSQPEISQSSQVHASSINTQQSILSGLQQPVNTASTLPPSIPPPDAVLAHLLTLMGAGPNASSYAVPSFQYNQQSTIVSEDPNDFDYDDEDDGLNSKPLSARPEVM